ncbi:hypothetical protein V0R37_13615 [Pollutimonas sp. H1-120]|uniref:hypothetical protein n=1 Tax=Pollutimonas sp. H1-120 TaxID=3148824 RepID=UPI003B5176CC
MTISKKINSMQDSIVDTLDKVSGPSSRAGVTLERIAKMAKAGVGNRAIAVQLEDNSHTRQQYSPQEIESFKKLFKDVETKVGVTATQARALIEDQVKNPKAAPPDAKYNAC